MSRVERDPERGPAVAAELKALGVKKREFIRAAEQGYITELACKMPECFCPEELGGASYFAQVTTTGATGGATGCPPWSTSRSTERWRQGGREQRHRVPKTPKRGSRWAIARGTFPNARPADGGEG